jgi:hypothetical protein
MLSESQRSEFVQRGLVRLAGAFAAAEAIAMCDRIWSVLAKRDGVMRGDPATWSAAQPCHFQVLRRAGVFEPVASPAVVTALDDLLGQGEWLRPRHWCQALVTFPRDGAWHVPPGPWHVDWPARAAATRLFAVKLLAFLSSVRSQGGGTLVVAGSHRLVERLVASGRGGGSASVRKRLLAADPWLRELASREATAQRDARLMDEGTSIDGVELRVLELTGEPGDVVLFHPWLLHAPAPNCATTPRLMVGDNVQTPSSLGLYAAAGA